MSPTRSVASVVGVLAVAFALAGCSLLPGSVPTPVAKASKPVSGQCWNATTTQAFDWADWKGPASVPCGSSHTLYTYRVGKISGESGDSWASPGDADSLTDEIQSKADNACNLTSLLPKLKWNQQLVNDFFFVPTETQWKAGARWVRCDVGVLATGTTLDNESFVALPSKIATLVGEISSDPVKYEFCLNSSTPVSQSGPLDNDAATLADCTDDPQWRLTSHGKFSDPAGAAFPGDATSNATSSKLCLPDVKTPNEVWIAYLPTKAGWASGDREIDCWVGEKSSDASGGTA